MSDFNTSKIDGNTVGGSEWNQLADVDNFVISSGQTPSTSNLEQLGIGSARYSSGGQFFTDSGTANAYVLTPVSPFKSAVSSGAGEGYFNGMIISFRAGNANSGASTVNVNSAGVKNLKKADGTDVATGDILTTRDVNFRYDGTNFIKVENVNPATNTIQGISYLPQKITIANNSTDANNDIDFSGGNFVFSDFSGQAYVPAMTKRLDANWTAGNNNGGLDTGTKAANTWYYCYAIYNPTTQASDFLFSASATSPTLPSGFTKIRKIASIRTNISGNIRNGNYSFFVNSYRFEYKTKVLIFQSTTSITGTVVDAECPPLTIAEIIADQSSTTDCSTLITSLDVDDEAPIHPSYANISSSSQYNGATTLFIRTNSLAQIRRRSSSTSGTLSLRAIGWIEYI
jgi:hypothetical protein